VLDAIDRAVRASKDSLAGAGWFGPIDDATRSMTSIP
jgi:hypothetical protein